MRTTIRMRTRPVPVLSPLVLLAWAASLAIAQVPQGQELLAKAVAADGRNKEIMVNYLFREAVRVHYRCDAGARGPDQSKVYEMILLEGEPYFQLVEENGSVLSAKKRRAEDEKMKKVAAERRSQKQRGQRLTTQSGRTAFRFERLAEFQDVRNVREEQWDGRRVFVLETEPRGSTTGGDKEDLILAYSRTKIWIDAETSMPLKGEARMLQKVGNWPKDMVLETEAQRLDDGWMPKRLYTYRPLGGFTAGLLKCDGVEVEQVFSKFRKFEAESKFYPLDIVP